MSARAAACCLLSLALIGCKPEAEDVKVEPLTVPALGNGAHSLDAVNVTVIGDSDDGLRNPRDLGFNPEVPGELWVVSGSDDAMVIFDDAGGPNQVSERLVDPYALHFMDNASSIAFGAPWTFGTCQESGNTYNGQSRANNFMGPTLWSSNREIFATSNPEAVAYLTDLYGFHTDLGSHLDMLHESPYCMGMAWERDNVYWVFDGHNSAIGRYDFAVDHGVGYDDHSDGVIAKYVTGSILRVEGVPSHLEFEHETSYLYIADTGNNTIKVLDTLTGQPGSDLRTKEQGTEHFEVDEAEMWNLVHGEDHGMVAPSGLALVGEVVLITDNATSTVWAFTVEGELIDHLTLDVEPGGLMGIWAESLDELWLTDAVGKQVLRLSAR
jgi:hypothetical protein